MIKRNLGRSGLSIAPLAFGGNVFGWTADEAMSFQLLDGFVAAGLNLIDTADVYSVWASGHAGGESENIIGRWLKRSGKRDQVLIATKVGMDMSPQLGKKSLSREYILQAVDASLRRLQISHIDLYQAHIDDPDTPLEETLDTFTQLIKQGKVRAIGASNYTAARLAEALRISEAHGFARYECLQPEYNLYDREDYEAKSQALCAEEEIGVISYFSLARGFLSGKYSCESDLDKSERGSGVKKYLNSRGFAIIDALKAIAADYRSTPAQIALAWLMARPTITAPIASATNLQQLHDLVESTKLALSPSAIAALDHASAYLPSPAGS